MSLRLYNTLTRKKEEFKSIEERKVKIYTCGPTVYNYGHIGNYRSFLCEDLLIRYLRYLGYEVTHVMNITDVDDKTIKNSRKMNMPLNEYTKKYTDAFFEDLNTLNIQKANFYPKATEHVNDMLEIINKIMDKGYAYKTEDNSVYFKVASMKDYGKLSKLDLSTLKEGASGRVSVDEYDKDNISDFTLWKGYTEDDGDVSWDSPYGKGRPGWHLECSAMSMKYLGDTIDIHCGGVDNMFPHHENEIAQSETATGKKFVNYWMHVEFLNFKASKDSTEEKMSKSLGNVFYIRDLLEKGYDGKVIRFAIIASHYKQQIAFSLDRFDEYKVRLSRYQDFINRLIQINKDDINDYDIEKLIKNSRFNFEEYMNDNLNISGALSSLDDSISEINKNFNKINKNQADLYLEYLKSIDKILGIFTFENSTNIDEEIVKLIKDRERARKEKDYKKADDIRNKITELGFILEDTPDGTKWKKI
jgi:cysteinyl-tRNA synthetase